ncbi:MAG: pseudouridine synthase [Bacteroidales bacterium]|nr:pseudouridine synthase [Bacteroidales bacterium]
MTEQENSGKRPRTRKSAEHKEEFLQHKSFRISHRDGDEEGEKKERKFGDKPRGERRRFSDSDERPRHRFNDDEERPRRRFHDDDEKPRRRFHDDDEHPRRKFNDDNDRPKRRFHDDDEKPRRRFHDDEERPRRRSHNDDEKPRRRFHDDDERPRRKFNDDSDRPKRRIHDDDEKPRRRFHDDDEKSHRRFHDDEEKPRRRFHDDDEHPRRKFDDEKPRGRRRADYEEEEAPRRGRKGYVREKDPMYDRPAATGEIRLNKYLADCGVCSRREADDLIKAGCVTVNGEVVTTMGFRVKTNDKVMYGGQTLNREKLRYILLNKPKGYITTADDPEGRETVMELVRDACNERIFPVGRLDKNTTGLLLLTNDGDLAKKLTHPSSEVSKLYHVVLDKPLTKNDMLRIADGIELDDGFIAADEIAYDEDDDSKKSIGIRLHSGRNRIVRRIFEHLGYDIMKLDRVMFAGLDKYKLPRGEWRFLTDQEVRTLKKI